MADLLGKPSFEKLEIDNWIELFKYFVEFYDGTGKIIFIFDEFSYLIELNRGITSVFQYKMKYWGTAPPYTEEGPDSGRSQRSTYSISTIFYRNTV